MNRLGLVGLLSLSLSLFLTACGEPSPDEVRERTSTIITRVINETGQSVRGAADLKEVKDLIDSLETMIPGLSFGDDSLQPGDPLPKGDGIDLSNMDEQEMAAEVNKFLADYIFTEKNVVSAGGDSITFQLKGADLCQEVGAQTCTATPDTPPVCTTDPEELKQCAEMVNKLQVRITATLIGGDGVDLALRIGSGTVVTLRLRSDGISVELDLDGLRAAAQHVASVTGENIYLPKTMKGALALSLIINGPGDLSVESAITRAVLVEAGDAGDPITVKVDARDPLTEVRYKSSGPSLAVNVDWGAVELLIPAEQAWEMATGSMSLTLQGLTANLFADNSGLKISGVSMGKGASTLKLNEKTLAEVELQSFDMELLPWQSLPKCVFQPGFDLKVKLNLAHLQPYVTDSIEPWALNESYSLTLTGPGPEVAPVPASAGFPEGALKVLKGTLTLQSQIQPASVTVPAGSCLSWSDQLSPGGHALLGHFDSVTCP